MKFLTVRSKIAGWLSPEREAQLNTERAYFQQEKRDFQNKVNDRVADIVMKMNPFEPFLKKYRVIFADQYENVEDSLDSPSQLRLFMWAWGVYKDPSFKYLMDWIRNRQGNLTLREAVTEEQWFYGRAALATIKLFIDEVGRLASHYEEMIAKKDEFDKHLTVE